MLDTQSPEITAFVAEVQSSYNTYMEAHCPNTTDLEGHEADMYSPKQKYVKVWRLNSEGKRSSIVAFVSRENGDVFKPASTKAPAKQARGNVFSDTNGRESLGTMGLVRYL